MPAREPFAIPNAQLYDYPYYVAIFETQPDVRDFDPHLTLCEQTLAVWYARGWRLLSIVPDVRGHGYRVIFEKREGGPATRFGNADYAGAWSPDFGWR
jgi:hypothetical protein